MATLNEVDLAFRNYCAISEKFLLENGWVVSEDGYENWGKGGYDLYTFEEAIEVERSRGYHNYD